MKSVRGISLIQLLIAVILISTVATAYMNLQGEMALSKQSEPRISTLDSTRFAVLDNIALQLQLARRDPYERGEPLEIRHQGVSDKILIRHDNVEIDYLVDDHGKLIYKDKSNQKTLAEEVIFLKAQKLGKETIVLTMATRPTAGNGDSPYSSSNSYSKVVNVDFPLR